MSDTQTRASRSARLLSQLQRGDQAPFALIGEEFCVGVWPPCPDAILGTVWMQADRRVVLLVDQPDNGLLFFLALWVEVWLPMFPALFPLQYARLVPHEPRAARVA